MKFIKRISIFVLLFIALCQNTFGQSSRNFGNSLPGSWRPFSADAPWNTEIDSNASIHPHSAEIIEHLNSIVSNVRFASTYNPPLWVVNADKMQFHFAESPYPFDIWDVNLDGITEAGVPYDSSMWGEGTADGHIIIIDTTYNLSWEMSRFKGIKDNGYINCSTFNIWDLKSKGVGDADEGQRWNQRGGRGGGFPIIAGLLRPEEVQEDKINHALVFSVDAIQSDLFIRPACRSDGQADGYPNPIYGMRFQLDPSLTEADFNAWGLNKYAKRVARALQKYGMYLCDSGGDMAIFVQQTNPDGTKNMANWNNMFDNIYSNIKNIPTDKFRVINTGEPVNFTPQSRAVRPLIIPVGGSYNNEVQIHITANSAEKITYTLDGSEPTDSSTLYIGPFPVNSDVVVKAKAFKIGFKDSHTNIARIHITSGAENGFSLVLSTLGGGKVIKNPDREFYDPGTMVELTAKPNAGYSFVGWQGDVNGSKNPAAVLMDRRKSVYAIFKKGTSGGIKLEEIKTGASSNSDTVSTSESVSIAADRLYIASIVSKKGASVIGVTGLGLKWSKVIEEMSGRSQTGVSVWVSNGVPASDGVVSAIYKSGGKVLNAVIVVSSFSGINLDSPIGTIAAKNTGGSDNDSYSFGITTTHDASIVYEAVAMRNRSHTPGNGFVIFANLYKGSDGDVAGISCATKEVDSIGTISVEGSFSGNTDWAVAAIELNPKALTGIMNEQAAIPPEYILEQNYPNPFNPTTIIRFGLPKSSYVNIKIYNMLGKEIKALLNEEKPAGTFEVVWDGTDNSGSKVTSGTYIYRITAGDFVATKKMLLIK